MTAGLLQLVAVGQQDVHLISNPEISFFKTVYRRHTNFAVSQEDLTFINGAKFGEKSTVVVDRKGDLLSKMYVRVVITGAVAPTGAKWAWVRRLGHELIKSVELSIGGQPIDKHNSMWFNTWYDLTHPKDKDEGYLRLIGDVPELTTLDTEHKKAVLYIPLQFFHCRRYGNPISLIGLQYHDVKLEIEFEKLENLLITSGFVGRPVDQLSIQIESASVVCDMILLDTDERKRFAQSKTQQLIEQVQWTGNDNVRAGSNRILLNFNHPIKEFIWAVRLGKYLNVNGDYKYLAYHPTDVDMMRLQATKRFALAVARYTGGNRLVLSDNLLVPAVDLPSALLDKFNSIQAAGITTDPVMENITILGDLLSIEDISVPTDKLLQDIVRPTEGHGAALYDVVVRMPSNYGLYLDRSGLPIYEATLQFNSHDRISREGLYYNYVQPLQHHTRTPPAGLCVYSFALQPEESQQPTGSCNASRLDSVVLSTIIGHHDITGGEMAELVSNDTNITIMALSLNILRLESGMGGLMYSN